MVIKITIFLNFPSLSLFPELVLQQIHPYLDAHICVMDVHLGPQIFPNLLLAQEILQEPDAILEVVTTHTPLPGFAVLQVRGIITGTALHSPSTACSSKGMS